MKKILIVSLLLFIIIFPTVASAQTTGLTNAQINAIIGLLQAFGADASTVTNVESVLMGNASSVSTASWCYTFNTNLRVGDYGRDVAALRTALSKNGFSGSQGSSFDERLASAVSGFQEKYTREVLSPYSLQRGTGYVGRTTRAKLNNLYGCGNNTGSTAVPPPTSVGVVQPNFPTATLSADKTSFISDGKPGVVTLSWSSQNTTSCYIGKTPVGTSGSKTESIYATTNYVLNCSGPGGGVSSNPVNVVYRLSNADSANPSITVISPNGGESYQIGNFITASWNAPGLSSQRQVDAYLVPAGNTGKFCYLGSASAVNGSASFALQPNTSCSDGTFITAGDYTLKLQVSEGVITVNILAEDLSNAPFRVTATPPTATLSADKIAFVSDGKPGVVTLSWSSQNTTSCYIGKTPVGTSGSKTESIYATTNYVLDCSGPGGRVTTAPVTVNYVLTGGDSANPSLPTVASVISSIQSVANPVGTINVNEKASIYGSGLNGPLTIKIGLQDVQTVLTTGILDGYAEFVVPSRTQSAVMSITVTNSSGQTSNFYEVSIVVPI